MYVTQVAFIRKFYAEFFSRFLKISSKTDASTDRPTSPNPFEEYVHFYLKMCTCHTHLHTHGCLYVCTDCGRPIVHHVAHHLALPFSRSGPRDCDTRSVGTDPPCCEADPLDPHTRIRTAEYTVDRILIVFSGRYFTLFVSECHFDTNICRTRQQRHPYRIHICTLTHHGQIHTNRGHHCRDQCCECRNAQLLLEEYIKMVRIYLHVLSTSRRNTDRTCLTPTIFYDTRYFQFHQFSQHWCPPSFTRKNDDASFRLLCLFGFSLCDAEVIEVARVLSQPNSTLTAVQQALVQNIGQTLGKLPRAVEVPQALDQTLRTRDCDLWQELFALTCLLKPVNDKRWKSLVATIDVIHGRVVRQLTRPRDSKDRDAVLDVQEKASLFWIDVHIDMLQSIHNLTTITNNRGPGLSTRKLLKAMRVSISALARFLEPAPYAKYLAGLLTHVIRRDWNPFLDLFECSHISEA